MRSEKCRNRTWQRVEEADSKNDVRSKHTWRQGEREDTRTRDERGLGRGESQIEITGDSETEG